MKLGKCSDGLKYAVNRRESHVKVVCNLQY